MTARGDRENAPNAPQRRGNTRNRVITKLRPGLCHFPDAQMYDEEIARMRGELGREPTQDDIARDLVMAAAWLAEGDPCVICSKTPARAGAAFLPNNVDSLVGYTCCEEHGRLWDLGDEATTKAIDDGCAELRKGRKPRVGDVFDYEPLGPVLVQAVERGTATVKALVRKPPRNVFDAFATGIYKMRAKDLATRQRYPIDDPRLAALGVTS